MAISSPNKLIIKNTGYLYIRSILLLFISLYTSRLILQVLGFENYGIYNVVGGVVAMFTILSSSMSSASQRYITFGLGESEVKSIHNIFQTCVNLHVVLAVIMIILIEIIGLWFVMTKLNIPPGRETATIIILQFTIVSLFINVTCVPYNALIMAHEHMKAFAYIGIFEAVAKLAITLLLTLINFDKLIIFCLLLLLCDIIKRIIFEIYCQNYFIESRELRWQIDKNLFKEMFGFSGWSLFGQGSYLLRNQGIDILMNIFFGVTINAAKGICNQVQNAVSNFVSNFQSALYPQVTKSLAQNDINRMHRLIILGSKISFFLLSIICIPLSINLQYILELWLVEIPQYTFEFIQLTLVFMLMDTQSRLLIHGIDSTGKIKKYQLIVGSTKLLALPITYLILRMGGNVMSGLIVNIGLEFICYGERLYFCKKQLSLSIVKFFCKVTLRCIFVLFISYGLSFIISYYIDLYFLLNIIISILILLSMIWLLGFDKLERIKIFKHAMLFIQQKTNKQS